MLVSQNWIRRYVDISRPAEEIAETLTFLGIEVEEWNRQGADLESVVSARVNNCIPHPDADQLKVCEVFDGKDTNIVVCGAPNVEEGQIVLFAKVGTTLPGGLKIKKAKIRGQVSLGMICAEDELGLGDNHEGIIVLPDNIQPGVILPDLPVCDTIYDLSITPNRPDALSHIGIAREIAAHYKLNLNKPSLHNNYNHALPLSGAILKVENQEACPFYTGRIITGVQIGPSPDWLKNYLTSVGQKSINNVVDITNFILLEFGQPSHAFDLDKISGKTIIVRKSHENESLTMLDGENINLHTDDLIIADEQTPLCLAGVMGGIESGVVQHTKNIFLEVAYFDPSVIRRQAKRHGITTDSSYRFERGVDPLNIEWISDYICQWICELTGGILEEGMLNIKSPHLQTSPAIIELRQYRLRNILGVDIPLKEIILLFKGIEINLHKINEDGQSASFLIPGFRPDLEREIDLIEEAARLFNFNNIPPQLPSFTIMPVQLPPLETLSAKLRSHLSSKGLNECISLRFTSTSQIKGLLANEADKILKVVKLQNPLSEDWQCMPTSLLPSLFNSIKTNQNNQQKNCRFFEIGKVFFNQEDKRSDKHPGVEEEHTLALVLSGDWNNSHWQVPKCEMNFHLFKGIIEGLFQSLFYPVKLKYNHPAPFLHPREQAQVYIKDILIGSFGLLNPRSAAFYELKSRCFAAEFSLSKVLQLPEALPYFKPYSQFSSVSREMNILVDENITHEDILTLIPSRVKYLESVRLNSIYRGEGIAEGKKAMHYSFFYRHQTRTLTDDEINRIQVKVAEALAQNSHISFK